MRIAFVSIGVISLLVLNGCSRSPEQIYEAVLGELEESVQVLNAEDQQMLDCCIWLHFRTDSIAFESSFADFTRQSIDYDQWSLSQDEAPWWKPENLGDIVEYFERTSSDGRLREGVYTNTIRDEVFYVNYYD